MSKNNNVIGIVLSNSTTSYATMQIFQDSENFVKSGVMVKIEVSHDSYILSRVVGIRYVHKYLEEGDIFTFARGDRRIVKQYESIIRRHGLSYSVAQLELLYTVKCGKQSIVLESISVPPKPGSLVYKLSKKDVLEISYGTRDINYIVDPLNYGYKNKIGFGYLYGYEERTPFIIDLNNITMHLAILGTTGSGKSYTAGYFIEQASRSVIINNEKIRGIPILMFDANGDYLDYLEDPSKYLPGYRQFYLFRSENSISRGASESLKIDISIKKRVPVLDFNDYEPYELAKIIILYHKGIIESSEQQIAILSSILEQLKSNGVRLNTVMNSNLVFELIKHYRIIVKSGKKGKQDFINTVLRIYRSRRFLGLTEDVLASLYDILSGAHSATIDAIARAFKGFVDDLKKYGLIRDSPELTKKFFEEITDPSDPSFVLFDFSSEGMPGIPLKLKQLIVYHVLMTLYKVFTEYKINGEQRVIIVGLEEAHNYAPNSYTYPIPYSIAKDALALVATQGRKFGISLLIISQRPIYVDPIVMSMMNTWIIHRISPADVDFVIRTSGGIPKYMIRKLVKLERGTAIVVGQLNTLQYPVIVNFKHCRRAPHKAGTFNLSNVFIRSK